MERRETPQAAASIERLLAPLITREMAAIAAIDAAIAAEQYPDYVVMYHGTKIGKQANVEQMATLIRRGGGVPPSDGGVRKYILKAQSSIAERVGGTTATLRAMRVAELRILTLYTDTLEQVDGLAKDALRKALGRTLVHCHLLTAHIAKRTGDGRDAKGLPQPLDHYFAGPTAKACMRCHLDRPGAQPALERGDPHPYTYVCAGCHVDVRGEFPPDLASQIDRWPQHRPARAGAAARDRTPVDFERDSHRALPIERLERGSPGPCGETRRDVAGAGAAASSVARRSAIGRDGGPADGRRS